MEELQQPGKDNIKRIISFRQKAYILLLAGYTQVEIANKLDITRDNFNRYYKDPAIFPGLKFLDKFDELFGEDLLMLGDYLKMYRKGNFPNAEEPLGEYETPGMLHEYLEALKDHIKTLKGEAETYKGQISFLQHLITRQLPELTPETTEEPIHENPTNVPPGDEASRSDD